MIETILFAMTSFLVGLSGALVPGPMLTVTISESVKKGFKAGPLVVSGHIITEITLMVVILGGLGWIIGSKTALFVIGTVGGLVLIFMGYNISKNKENMLNVSKNKVIGHKYGSVFSGVITSVSNPYFFIWWATVGFAFMFKGLELAGIFGLLGFLLGHWSADLGWYGVVSFFTSKGSKVMDERSYQLIMKICGVFLIFLGIYFILSVIFNHIFIS